MRTISVVTVARSDYGYLLPVLRHIQGEPRLRLHLIVAGMHLSPEFGSTVLAIEQDGFKIDERIEMLLSSDTPEGVAKSMGLGMIGFAQLYSRFRPDMLLVLGDRYEMHAAVVASLPFRIPIAHIHGGESTEGAIDEGIRHAITKMSHLHFTSTEFYRRRIIQMGEEPWRVVVSGAPSLDNLRQIEPLSRQQLEEQYGIDLGKQTLLVTYHPVTLEYDQTEAQVGELFKALQMANMAAIFTYPNADTYGRKIIQMIHEFAGEYSRSRVIINLGVQGYFSLMKYATAIVGNSSSGIIEAASFKLPVVNVGNRQRGRHHGTNIIDVGYDHAEILAGIQKAVSPTFRAGLADVVNPYGDGHAAERIVERIVRVDLDDKLLLKRFCDHRDES